MKIKAAVVYEKKGKFNIEEVELDEPRDDEVVVRILSAGLCHTDIVAWEGHMPIPFPFVLGHEGAGIVEKVGKKVRKVKEGDRVSLNYLSCGHCRNCLRGLPSYCLNFFQYNFSGLRGIDGSPLMKKENRTIHGSFLGQSAFASHVLINERGVVKIEEEIPIEIVGPLSCGIQTGSGAVINGLKVRPGSSIAIFGVGPVGMGAVMASHLCGCSKIIAVDLNPERLKIAKELGATHTINPNEQDPIETIKAITDGGAEYTLECVGNPKVLRQAIESLMMTGICGLLGVAPFGTEVTLDMQTLLNGRSVKGIIMGETVPELFIPMLIEFYKEGRFPFDRMITFYKFEDINKAVKDFEDGKALKVVLTP